ncbi:MAG: hypothetical protein MJ236_02540 [Clostridia bacterium]|nr:hypothetical protein [Clostridia bacterium]
MATSTKAKVTKTQAEDTSTTEEVVVKPETKPEKKVVPVEIDPTQYVTVRNGFQGTLIYKSKHTGEVYVWEGFGAEQEIELRELKSAKNSSKQFFVDNLFMFDEDWIIDYLGVRQFYKNALTIDDFDNLFEMKAGDLKKKLSELSNGQKRSVAYRASQLIAEGKIDSRSVISTLEESLGVELIEK